jgi:DNA-binding CsgD family transcriptional regulator
VLGRLAVEIHDTDSRARREALIAEAIQMSKRLGDPAIKAHALIASLGALVFPDNAHERLIAAREVTQLAESTGDHEGAIFGSHFTLPVLLQMGEMSAYDDELIKLRTLADRIRRPIWRWDALAFSATRATMQGRFEEGEALAREALALGRERRSAQNARGSFETQMIVLRRLQGRARELEVDVKRTLERFPEIAVRRAALASIYCDLGSGLDARREFEHLAVDGFTRILPHTMWLCTMSLLSETCAYLRDRRTAQALYGRLNRYALQNISGGGVAVYGSASRYLGLLVTTMCRWDDAERHFQDALEMNARMEARPWVTHTQYDYANMLLARRGPGDRKKAYALLKEALEAAREMGMKSLEERAQKLLESRKGLVPKYPDGLSRREVDVLRLIAAGGSNSQIAEQLFLSVRTVERHITNAYGKIGAGGRADATAYALSHGLAARESQAAGV